MLLGLELEMKKLGSLETWKHGFLVSLAKKLQCNVEWRRVDLKSLVDLSFAGGMVTNDKVFLIFQHGRRLMVDQCTTCECFLSAPRKYTLKCTKLNCQSCPGVSASPLGTLLWNVSDEGCVFNIHTSLCLVQLWGFWPLFGFLKSWLCILSMDWMINSKSDLDPQHSKDNFTRYSAPHAHFIVYFRLLTLRAL